MTRRSLLKAIAATGAGVVAGGGGYGYLYERHALELAERDVPVNGLPQALSGLRIGLLTDIHRSKWVSEAEVREAVELLMSGRPDLVVLGGEAGHHVIDLVAAKRRGLDRVSVVRDLAAPPEPNALAVVQRCLDGHFETARTPARLSLGYCYPVGDDD